MVELITTKEGAAEITKRLDDLGCICRPRARNEKSYRDDDGRLVLIIKVKPGETLLELHDSELLHWEKNRYPRLRKKE